jgi:hypothetical protein
MTAKPSTKPRKPSRAHAEREERLRADTELLGSVNSIAAGLSSLADSFSLEMQRACERIGTLERRLVEYERFAVRLCRVLDELERDRDQSDWWRGNGGTPNA